MKRYLLITIDTEEEFDWRGFPFSREGGTVRNIGALRHLQDALSRLGTRVTYFVDYPVLKDPAAASTLKEFHEEDGAEMGSHLHPWCTPPFEEALSRANTMANRLPGKLVKCKLEELTNSFVKVFGFPPLCYRAGRFGFDGVSGKIIAELGYTVDSSVTPFYDWSKNDGPNFYFAPLRPFWMRPEDLSGKNGKGGVLEVPVSAGFNRIPFHIWSKLYWFARHRRFRRLRLVGALDRSKLLRRFSLGPEIQNVEEMKRLVKNLCREKIEVFNMLFHSSSLLPGGNSLVRTPEEARAFEKRVTDIVSWMVQERNFQSITVSDVGRIPGINNSSPAPSAHPLAPYPFSSSEGG